MSERSYYTPNESELSIGLECEFMDVYGVWNFIHISNGFQIGKDGRIVKIDYA